MTVSSEQVCRFSKLSYIIFLVVAALFVIHNIQSWIQEREIVLLLQLASWVLNMITATFLLYTTKDTGTTIYSICFIAY